MDIIRNNDASGSLLTLNGDLTIYTVTAAKTVLLDDYENVIDPVALDLKNITDIDTAGIQLLLFTKKLLANTNKRLYLKHSNTLVDAALHNFSVADSFTLG
jgi:anti-sigma B factor antagonist